jgi:hypothetical protein
MRVSTAMAFFTIALSTMAVVYAAQKPIKPLPKERKCGACDAVSVIIEEKLEALRKTAENEKV